MNFSMRLYLIVLLLYLFVHWSPDSFSIFSRTQVEVSNQDFDDLIRVFYSYSLQVYCARTLYTFKDIQYMLIHIPTVHTSHA
jgi:hypothetical protein